MPASSPVGGPSPSGGGPAPSACWKRRAGPPALRPARPRPGDPGGPTRPARRQAVAAVPTAAGTGEPTADLLRRQAALEDRVRRQARTASGSRGAPVGGAVSGRDLRAALGEQALVELVDVDGALF